MFTPPEVGAVIEATFTVTEADLSSAFGNSGVRVLASPRLQHWVEYSINRHLWPDHVQAGELLLGTEFYFTHLAPTPIGQRVTIRVEMTEVDRRRSKYAFTARDEAGVISEGWMGMFLMQKARFEERLATRTQRS